MVDHPWGRWGEEEQGRREGEGQAEEELKRLHLCSRRVYYYQQEGKNCPGGALGTPSRFINTMEKMRIIVPCMYSCSTLVQPYDTLVWRSISHAKNHAHFIL